MGVTSGASNPTFGNNSRKDLLIGYNSVHCGAIIQISFSGTPSANCSLTIVAIFSGISSLSIILLWVIIPNSSFKFDSDEITDEAT
ncbi:hypothetical protein D3C75_626910 [compost metagenome]